MRGNTLTPDPIVISGHLGMPLDAEPTARFIEGTPIAATAPAGVHVCRLNGQWLSRDDWAWPLESGDVVEWFEVPQDRGTLRTALQIAVAVASIYLPPLAGLGQFGTAALTVGVSLAGNLAINALLPLQQQGQADLGSASPTYSAALAGNNARLYQPIPKILGTHLTYPPFAAQPYTEFDDNDQYYRALFCVGIGQHTIIRTLIDDTDINRFADVRVARYLPPGVAPSDVLPNVVSAPEVAGGELRTGRYMGGFAACGPRLTALSVGVDIIAPRGLLGNDGSARSVAWRVESRPVDEFGAPTAAWATLATETRTATTSTAQRWTNRYTLAAAARVEIRVVRTDTKDETAVGHEIQWSGLRAYLAQAAPLNPAAAHFEVVMRASEQLSGLTQRRFALLTAAHARTWNASTGWGPYAPTRNPAWWLAELWSSQTWGEGLPDSRIDLPTLAALAAVWDERQDRCDYVLDATMDAWDCAQLIARTGRARVFRRGGVYTVARDALATLPVTAFSPRNCAPNSMSMSEGLRTKDSPDGVIVEYFDNRAWDWTEIEQPLPGVSTIAKPVIIRLPGVTGLQHARREARYEAAALAYRTRTVSCVTEMQGMLPAYLQPVLWQPDMAGYGSSGDVVGVSGGDITVSEPIPAGATSITLIRDDGTAQTLAGSRSSEYVFAAVASPDFTPNVNGGLRERTRYLTGSAAGSGRASELVRIAAISDGGRSGEAQLWRIDASIDDARVHSADSDLLPVGETVQDPIDSGAVSGGSGGGGGGIIVGLSSREIVTFNLSTDTGGTASLTLQATGQAVAQQGGKYDPPTTLPGEWTPAAPIDGTEAALWETRATLLDGGPLTSGTVGSWLALSTSRTWALTVPADPAFALLRIEIRDIATATLQADAIVRLVLQPIEPPDTGGE